MHRFPWWPGKSSQFQIGSRANVMVGRPLSTMQLTFNTENIYEAELFQMGFSIPRRSTFITLTQNKNGPPCSRAAAQGLREGSASRGACHRARQPQHDPGDPHGGGENRLVNTVL